MMYGMIHLCNLQVWDRFSWLKKNNNIWMLTTQSFDRCCAGEADSHRYGHFDDSCSVSRPGPSWLQQHVRVIILLTLQWTPVCFDLIYTTSKSVNCETSLTWNENTLNHIIMSKVFKESMNLSLHGCDTIRKQLPSDVAQTNSATKLLNTIPFPVVHMPGLYGALWQPHAYI